MTLARAPLALDPARLGLAEATGEVPSTSDSRFRNRVAFQPLAAAPTPTGSLAATRLGHPVVIGTPGWYAALGGLTGDVTFAAAGWGTPGRVLRLPRAYCGPVLPPDRAAELLALGVDLYPPPGPADPTGVLYAHLFTPARPSDRPADVWAPAASGRCVGRCIGSSDSEPLVFLDADVAALGGTIGGRVYLAADRPPDFRGGATSVSTRSLVPSPPPFDDTPTYPLPVTASDAEPEPGGRDGYTLDRTETTHTNVVAPVVVPNPDYDPLDPFSQPFLRWVERTVSDATVNVYRPTAASASVFDALRAVYGPCCQALRIAGRRPDAAGADHGWDELDDLADDAVAFFS